MHSSDDDRGLPTVILCGGRGTRMGGLSTDIPKPMLQIGSRPILWHVMKLYATFGHTQFVLALGHLGDVIREYFLHYEALASDYSIELGRPNSIEFLNGHPEQGWRITCVETGAQTLTGTRVLRAMRHQPAGPFMVTYGDGVGDVDIASLVRFHETHGKLATMTAVHPPGRFGELRVDPSGVIEAFEEKPQVSSGAINGGFMVFEHEVLERYIPVDDDVMLEREPLNALASDGELMAFRHDGFWQPMDTPRERDLLSDLWASGKAPWKIWSDNGG